MRITISQPNITFVIADITSQELPSVIDRLGLNHPIAQDLRMIVHNGGRNGFLIQFETKQENKRYVIDKLISLGIIQGDKDITVF